MKASAPSGLSLSNRLPGVVTLLVCAAGLIPFAARAGLAMRSPGLEPDGVIVQSKFGGQIFGFDIDQAGNEGVLCEAQDLQGGKVLAAIETFDQTTGAIIKVIQKTQTHDDFLTLGVVGNSVGLVEHEHPIALLNVVRSFLTLNPLDLNKITGRWTPPIDKSHLISAVSRNQGTANVSVFAMDNSGNFVTRHL